MTLLFAVACGLAVANIYYAQPLLGEIAREFGMREATAGAVMTATQIGYGLGLLLIVPLGDLLDRRRLIVSQSLLLAAALVAVTLAPTSRVLLAALALVGTLAVVTQVLVSYAAVAAHPHARGQTVGIVTSGIVIGILAARTVSGTVSDVLGWRSVYLISAVATLAIAVLLAITLPRQQRPSQRVALPQVIWSVITLFASEPVLRVRSILALLVFAAMMTLLTPMALLLSAPPHSLSQTKIGLFGLAAVAGAVAASRAGRLADRGLAQPTTAVGLGCMLVSWLAACAVAESMWGLIIAVVLLDFGLQSVHVCNQSLIYRSRPQIQSRLTAAYMIFYSIGCAAGSIVSTAVFARAGWNGVCVLGATFSALASAFWAKTRHLTPEQRVHV